MTESNKMETSTSIYRLFIKYVSLNVLSMIGLSCYIFADTFFVANGIGSNGLAALNLAIPVFSVVNGLGLMFGMGGATQYAVLTSNGSKEGGNLVFTNTVKLALAVGLLFALVGILFSSQIAALLGADDILKPYVVTYIKYILIFAPAFLLNNVLVFFIRNDNNPNLSMAGMLTSSFSNIILDYIFIFPLNLGMFGAVFATGLAPIFSMLVLSLHFTKHKNNFKLTKGKQLKNTGFKTVMIGLPSFINEFSIAIIMLLFNFTIIKITGNIGVAAYGIIANIALIVIAVFNGIAQGIQPLISSSLGRGNYKDIKIITYLAVGLAIFFGALFYLIGYFNSDGLIAIFNSENNNELLEIARAGIKIYFIAFFFMGTNAIISTVFAAIEVAVPSFLISIMRGLILVIPLILILPSKFGMTGIWMVIPTAELLTIFFSIITLFHYFRTKLGVKRLGVKHISNKVNAKAS